VRDSNDPEVFRCAWQAILTPIEEAGAEVVLVACLDLSGVLRHAAAGRPIRDAARCLAQAVIRHWRGLAGVVP
jgi:aspartate/glutamate racemase